MAGWLGDRSTLGITQSQPGISGALAKLGKSTKNVFQCFCEIMPFLAYLEGREDHTMYKYFISRQPNRKIHVDCLAGPELSVQVRKMIKCKGKEEGDKCEKPCCDVARGGRCCNAT